MTSSCAKFYQVEAEDGCYHIAAVNKVDLSDFSSWNLALKDDCYGLFPDYYVRVGLSGSSTTATPTSVKPTDGVSTPSPVREGTIKDCNKFYKCESGDTCYAIAKDNSVALCIYWFSPVSLSSLRQPTNLHVVTTALDVF